MKLGFALLAFAIGYWLGWYYGAILGYYLVPNNEWFGAAFAYLTGPLCAIVAALVTWRVSRRFSAKIRYQTPKGQESKW